MQIFFSTGDLNLSLIFIKFLHVYPVAYIIHHERVRFGEGFYNLYTHQPHFATSYSPSRLYELLVVMQWQLLISQHVSPTQTFLRHKSPRQQSTQRHLVILHYLRLNSRNCPAMHPFDCRCPTLNHHRWLCLGCENTQPWKGGSCSISRQWFSFCTLRN